MLSYYLLDGSIYQAPLLCNIFAARIGRALYYIQKAFTTAASKLEKIGYVDAKNEGATLETKVTKETIDFKEVKRVEHILASLQRKGHATATVGTAANGYDGDMPRNRLWLNSYPLDRNMVFDYFALSPFYDWICNNEQLRMGSIHPLDISQLSKMSGIEYMLSEVMESCLLVIRKQKRDSPKKVTPMLSYYLLDGSIYQAPLLCNIFAARIRESSVQAHVIISVELDLTELASASRRRDNQSVNQSMVLHAEVIKKDRLMQSSYCNQYDDHG
ncbi:hypothetical protein LWI29_002383 [Acer saccharum]|uniref:Mediator of RNA polymerase II transcription subunit 6 n=1 Tax=Acer saccharum TaxID=4024 RepID=A0AA39VW17_ACESA|nr:hypothetical protein LWI29_002383 [Acer saccharum]